VGTRRCGVSGAHAGAARGRGHGAQGEGLEGMPFMHSSDIEVSTAPEMYLLQGHIFRAKYAGPGILRNPACDISFAGSNVTTTSIVFPAGYWITVSAGTPIYVHMDVINWTPYAIAPMTQDVYLYYSEAPQ
jgi:hypothetical protein